MRELRTSGSVGDQGGNALAYPTELTASWPGRCAHPSWRPPLHSPRGPAGAQLPVSRPSLT